MRVNYRVSFTINGEFRSYPFVIEMGNDDYDTVRLMAQGCLFEAGWSQVDNLDWAIEYNQGNVWHNIED